MKVLSLMLALLLLVPMPATAKDKKDKNNGSKSDVSEQIKSREKSRAEAVVKGDIAYMDKDTADDYTLVNASGQVSTKQQMLDALKDGTLKLTKDDVDDITVHMYGNTAVAIGTSTVSGTMGGHSVDNQQVRFTRVWVKQGGDWKSTSMQQTEVKQ